MINLDEWRMTEHGYVRTVASTDIMLPADQRADVYDWCWAQGIVATLEGVMAGTDIWAIDDSQHRVWFRLRWL
jgi:hypothetical protein